MFCKKAVLKKFAKFTGNQLCQSLSFSKVAGLSIAPENIRKPLVQRCSVKKVVFETLQNSQENTLCQSRFFNKVAGLRPAALIKSDSGTDVFLSILRNFYEHLFYRTAPGDCFCKELDLEFLKFFCSVDCLHSFCIAFNNISWDPFILC